KPFARAGCGIEAEDAAITGARHDDVLRNLRCAQHFAGELRSPQLLAAVVERDNFTLRAAHQHEVAVTADAARQRAFGVDAAKHFAGRGIEAQDLPGRARDVNHRTDDRRAEYEPRARADARLPRDLRR